MIRSSDQTTTNYGLACIFFLLLIFLPVQNSLMGQPPGNDSLQIRLNHLNASELTRGERLFYGLVYLKNKSVNCAGCHNTVYIDTMNWNPSAMEIAVKYKDKKVGDLVRVLLKPRGKMLSEVHAKFDLSPEDIVMIKGFMDEFTTIGIKPPKPVLNKLILFILASLLFLFSVVDLIFTKRVKRKWIHLVIILGTGFFITDVLVVEAVDIGRSQYYQPNQPVKFSHAVHAGQNQTACIYCHSSSEFSKEPTIPGVNVCMNCHLIVRNGSRSGTFEIAKVVSAYQDKKPIAWIRVHHLPDHVFFSHAQHVSAGKVDCSECHGDVTKMDRIMQVSDLSMGWCIECHRTRAVNFDSNAFYNQYKQLKKQVKSGNLKQVTVEDIGGTECMKCHY